jgi:hypothetical protein
VAVTNQPPILDQILREYGEARKYHDAFRQKVERGYKSYRGVLRKRSDAAKWTSKQHPPYVFQMVETLTANTINERTKFRVRPRPNLHDLASIDQRTDAAKSLEYLLRYQQDVDHYQESLRPFALQGAIAGLTVRKQYWKYAEATRTSRTVNQVPIYHPDNQTVIGHVPQYGEESKVEVVHDGPTSEVVDVRDFIWHEAARSVADAQWIIHRVWMTYGELEEMAHRGVYDLAAVEQLKESQSFMDDLSNREEELFSRRRTKDLIEVLERWTDERVVTVANKKVVLSDRPNPFWHGEKPFVICSSMPDLFSINGISDVEIVEQLQEMLWTVMNQRLDNLLLINNAIILLRSDIDDPEMFEFAPGAQWIVDDPAQVVMWTPNPMPAEVSVAAENMLKNDLQNISGGAPLMGGNTDSVDTSTATATSIFTSLAQKRMAAKKQHFAHAEQRVAEQWIALDQQFLTDTQVVQIVGKGGSPDWITVKPEEINGRFNIEVDAGEDSFMRQEKRAEGGALVQQAAAIAPVMQAVGQPLNMKAFVEDWLSDYDKNDIEKYFAAAPQPGLQQGPPGQQGQPGPDGNAGPAGPQGPGGVTAPQSIAPEVSPSNQASAAPSVMLSRAMAAQGGPRNGGNH